MPVILLTAAVSNIYFFSQILYKRFPDNRVVGLFGVWQVLARPPKHSPLSLSLSLNLPPFFAPRPLLCRAPLLTRA
jgi:hypothetical protein